MQQNNFTVDAYHFDSCLQQQQQQQHSHDRLQIQQQQHQQHFGIGNNNGDEYEKAQMDVVDSVNHNNNGSNNNNNNNNDDFFMDYGEMGSLTDEDLGGIFSDNGKFLQFSPNSMLDGVLEQSQTNSDGSSGVLLKHNESQQINSLNIHDNNNSKLCQNNNLIDVSLGSTTLQQQQPVQNLNQDLEDQKAAMQPPTLPPIVISPADVDSISIQLEKNQQCACKDCGKLFNSVWYLKQHAVKHSNDRPFKCKFCMKTYKFRSNLYQHKCLERTRHENEHSSRRRLYTRNAEMRHHNQHLQAGATMMPISEGTDPQDYDMLREMMMTLNPPVKPNSQPQAGGHRQHNHQRPARIHRQSVGASSNGSSSGGGGAYLMPNYTTGTGISESVFPNYSGTQSQQQPQQQHPQQDDSFPNTSYGNSNDKNNNNNNSDTGFYCSSGNNCIANENSMTAGISTAAKGGCENPVGLVAKYYGMSTNGTASIGYPTMAGAGTNPTAPMMGLAELDCGECCFGGPQHIDGDSIWSTMDELATGGCSLRATPLGQDYIDSYMQKNKNKVYPCRKCKLSFPSREYLDRHVAYHNALECEPFVCDRCPQRFANDKLLQCHFLQHADRSPHKCPQCYGIFRSALALRRHKDQCRQCYCPPFGIHPRLMISPSAPLDPYGFVESEDEIVRSNNATHFLQQPQPQCRTDAFFASSAVNHPATAVTDSGLSSDCSTTSHSMTISPNGTEITYDDSHNYHNNSSIMMVSSRLSTVHEKGESQQKGKGIEEEDEDEDEDHPDKKKMSPLGLYGSNGRGSGIGLPHQSSIGSGNSKYPDETDSGFRSRLDSMATTGAESYSSPASSASSTTSSSSSGSSGSASEAGPGSGFSVNRRTRQSAQMSYSNRWDGEKPLLCTDTDYLQQFESFSLFHNFDAVLLESNDGLMTVGVRRIGAVFQPSVSRKSKSVITFFDKQSIAGLPLDTLEDEKLLSPKCRTTNFEETLLVIPAAIRLV